MDNSSKTIIEIIAGNTWTVFLVLIPTLLALSTLFFSMESSYRQNYRNAELSIISYTFSANAADDTSGVEYNKRMAKYWVETAVDYKDNGEQRAFSARLLFVNLLVSVALVLVLLILFVPSHYWFPGPPWQWVKFSFILTLTLISLLFITASFISTFWPRTTPRFLKDFNVTRIESYQYIDDVFRQNEWLIEDLDAYMDGEKAKKSYFGLESYNARKER